MFNPDQPIKSNKEDILGRVFFARSLCKAILSYREKDSLVIGLFGAWGSCKALQEFGAFAVLTNTCGLCLLEIHNRLLKHDYLCVYG